MKNGKKPTRRQKGIIKLSGLNPEICLFTKQMGTGCHWCIDTLTLPEKFLKNKKDPLCRVDQKLSYRQNHLMVKDIKNQEEVCKCP